MAGTLGDMLISAGLITDDQLREALVVQKDEGGRLTGIVVKKGYVPEDKLMEFMSKRYGVPFVDLKTFQIQPAGVWRRITDDIARKYWVMWRMLACPRSRLRTTKAMTPLSACSWPQVLMRMPRTAKAGWPFRSRETRTRTT